MANELNQTQTALLRLIVQAGEPGCLVYGRGPAETVRALVNRRLVHRSHAVQVASMGMLEQRWIYYASVLGLDLLKELDGGVTTKSVTL
jgi:hypothetical protein